MPRKKAAENLYLQNKLNDTALVLSLHLPFLAFRAYEGSGLGLSEKLCGPLTDTTRAVSTDWGSGRNFV